MRRFLFSALAVLLLAGMVSAEEARLLRYPDIHKDTIAFTYGGDIWTVSAQGGVARRITSDDGMEIHPKFSPDGKWIAFTGQYDGNWDVYIVPAQGGQPKRLTFHPGMDRIVDWFPDGQHVLYRSIRNSHSYRFNRHHKVSIEGTRPEVMPLPEAELGSFNADGKKIAYNRMAREFRTWKRYRGGTAQDVYVYDFENNTQENISGNAATDAFPMWMGDTIYFISDRDEADFRRNIYSYNTADGTTGKITNYTEWDVAWPSNGPDAIVYELGGWLHVLDPASGESRKVEVTLYDDKRFTRPELKNVTNFIHSFSISPTGKRAVFEARGEIFTVPAEKGSIRKLTDTPGVREGDVAWSPNGKYIAYRSDATGEQQIYIRPADGKGEARQITKGLKKYIANINWSPDSKMIMFSTSDNRMHYVTVETGEITEIFWAEHNGTGNFVNASWSADSKWITYSKPDPSGYGSIYVYNLAEAREYQVTSTLTDDNSPAFGPEGKYLFWIANREFNPGFSAHEFQYYFQNPGKVVVATLQADTANPFAPESDEAVVKEEKEEEADSDKEENGEAETDKAEAKEDAKEDKKASDEAIKIELEGIEDRMVNLPVPDGNYMGVLPLKGAVVIAKMGTGLELHRFDMKKQKTDQIISGIQGAAFSADRKKFLYRQGRNYGIADLAPKQKPGKGKLNLAKLSTTVDYLAEWKQIYFEAWRQFRDYFYDPNMHGVDWEKVRDQYAALLPYLSHRDDLNYVIGEMIGELNSGHTYRRGGEYPNVKSVPTGVLACDFEAAENGYYKISKIYQGQNWDPNRYSPLTMPGLNVKEGDYLLAINGSEIKAPENPLKHLVNTVGEQVTLKISSSGTAEDAREIVVKPVSNDQTHRYITWVMENIEKVNQASDGKIGYIHVPDTAFGGMEWFNRLFYPQINKEALLVDARWNSGGFIPNFYLERLARQLTNVWKTPYSSGFRSPGSAHYGPKACLTNEWAGSGGDAFPFYFRHLGLGPVIGKRSWGGLIGISGNPVLMDNGTVSVPDFAFVNVDGEFDVENKGVTPDIIVENDAPSIINGGDPQLEKGIEVLLEALNNQTKKPVPDMPRENPIR